MKEFWKDLHGYEGLYQVSNLGNVKSLDRIILDKRGIYQPFKGRILKQNKRSKTCPYLCVGLHKNGKIKLMNIHQLVAIVFLHHFPNGHTLVVNHINHIKTDNRLENLEVITNKKNTSRTHIKSSSQYMGVSWMNHTKKWQSYLNVNGKRENLGYYRSELDAFNVRKKRIEELNGQ